MKNDITNTTICNNAVLGPPTKSHELGAGVVQGTITPPHGGPSPAAIAK